MYELLDSASMKQCDMKTMEHFGMVSAVLMERAALSTADEIICEKPDTNTRVLIACGTGNNGGDGIAIARLLHLKGYPVTILFCGKKEKCSVEAARQLRIAENYGVPITSEIPDEKEEYGVIVDALFGIGLDRPVGGIYQTVIEALNQRKGWKVAVDISSGISADTGAVMGTAFLADLTVTFGFAKIGQLLYPGAAYTGKLEVKEIGIDRHSLPDRKRIVRVPEKEDLKLLVPRKDHSNKGTYGKILLFCGSQNMAGAAVFCAKAAYRCGAGLVKAVIPEANRQIMQTLVPEAILASREPDAEIDSFVKDQIPWADAIVLGPGLGTSEQAGQLVRSVLASAEVPCVIDADALNILAMHPDWFSLKKAPWILTPHPGEMSRLTQKSIGGIQKDLIEVASAFANRYDVITVLKDAHTVTAAGPDEIYINVTGNHGMAAGGSGDALSGIIGALLGQGNEPVQAAFLGVMIHGMAGDLAAEQTGKSALMASDLIEGLCRVLP